MKEWLDSKKDGWVKRQICGGWMDGKSDRWMHRRSSRWMKRWMNRQTDTVDEWMDG